VLFGPTAVGKTELLARLFPTPSPVEIISADSMQVYRCMDVGTAKPPIWLRQRLPHHLLDVVEPDRQFNAGEFVHRADALVAEILGRGHRPVLCGGSAYYLRSFINGLPGAPPADAGVRAALKEALARRGLVSLREELQQVDPASARAIGAQDAYRVLRALEVYRVSGRPRSSFLNPGVPRSCYRFLLIGLQRPREELYRRIDTRVEEMLAGGLASEVSDLLARGYGAGDPGMRGIGYKEFLDMEARGQSMREVGELIKRNSRRYAKRQITFFRSLPGVRWHSPEDVLTLRTLIEGHFAGGVAGACPEHCSGGAPLDAPDPDRHNGAFFSNSSGADNQSGSGGT
jgi:tRNA dimethylallyltransferase